MLKHVEGTTGASGTTPLSIPQGVTIWPENRMLSTVISYACFIEVVLHGQQMREHCFCYVVLPGMHMHVKKGYFGCSSRLALAKV